MSARFERVAIIGVGLIGGSFALALKAAGACGSVIGVGRNPDNLARARALGVIDAEASDAGEAAEGADLILLAAPVAQTPQILRALAPRLAPRALVTDAGSTKRDAVAAARGALGARVAQFVPGHPIAGAEASGVAAARVDLFRGERVVLTPLEENGAEAVARIEALWTLCGARVSSMTPEAHDAVFAAVSHLPHLLAYALVHAFAERDDHGQLFDNAGAGFRDFTRIASSHPEMWRDICLANRDLLVAECLRYREALDALRAMVERGDGAGLERLFAAARDARNAWLQGAAREAGGSR
ncbi:MAG: prephenate dehydrogenase/arogenate dehydrogenase family protein [Betaproteobacteria bacterium]|jgi:prephenate dehydrogenase|nr:prephenate dehydrogenase/arogenate dehydrogenase family protein [Betaproteobacteria bacterium]